MAKLAPPLTPSHFSFSLKVFSHLLRKCLGVFSSLEVFEFFEVCPNFFHLDSKHKPMLWPHQSLHGKGWLVLGSRVAAGTDFRRFCRMPKNAKKEGNHMMISYTERMLISILNICYMLYVKIYSNISPIWMIYQKFRVSYASGEESQPLNNTSRTLC